MAVLDNPLLKRPLYVYDLPRELLETLQLKLDQDFPNPTTTEEQKPHTQAEEVEDTTPRKNGDTPKTISCGLCSQTFVTVQEQRSHVRSDLHNYNLKQKVRGAKPVTENEFEHLVANLDESLSGSDSESSVDEDEAESHTKKDETMLSALLKKQIDIEENDEFVTRKRKRGAGKAPLLWLTSSALPTNVSLGVYRALLTSAEQEEDLMEVLRRKQLSPKPPHKRADDEGGVALPFANVGPHIFLCMIGGGHFAGMIVSLAPKMAKKGGMEERQASVIAHKTFHRYTTRRKQGGSQAANDSAKGAAHSAGSSLRRYNEDALTKEIRELLLEWKDLIASSDLLFIRATSTTNRRTLFGPYDHQVLKADDPRIRGFPFSTRRATQAELMRSFVELTRVKVNEVDEAAEAEKRAIAIAEEEAKATTAALKYKASQKPKVEKDLEAETALLHTSQLEALIRRSKAPALVAYISSNSLTPDFELHPLDSQQHHHTPTPLHMAASLNMPALVSALLVKAGSDPSVLNGEGRSAFEVAGDRATRDAFRLSRSELGETKWDWTAARIPDALSKVEVDKRAEREKQEESAKESSRRTADLERLKEEEKKKAAEKEQNINDKRDKRMGKGRLLSEKVMTAEERREEEARGMTPEMRMRLERERRARAAEERMKRA